MLNKVIESSQVNKRNCKLLRRKFFSARKILFKNRKLIHVQNMMSLTTFLFQ